MGRESAGKDASEQFVGKPAACGWGRAVVVHERAPAAGAERVIRARAPAATSSLAGSVCGGTHAFTTDMSRTRVDARVLGHVQPSPYRNDLPTGMSSRGGRGMSLEQGMDRSGVALPAPADVFLDVRKVALMLSR